MSLSSIACSIPSPSGAGDRRTPPLQVVGVFAEMWCEFHGLFLSVTKGKQDWAETLCICIYIYIRSVPCNIMTLG